MNTDQLGASVLHAADALIEQQARLIESQRQAIISITQALAVQTRAIDALETRVHTLRGGMQEP